MPDFSFIHRSISETSLQDSFQKELEPRSLLVWKTCRRQIFFLNLESMDKVEVKAQDQLFSSVQAQAFLAEILCGLHSPLIGETEVFGQFKSWWKELPDNLDWKIRHQSKIDNLFYLVKNIREKILCGQGSPSYGSLLRRQLGKEENVDVLGAGHLVQEIIPWIQEGRKLRIWCRNPEKVQTLFPELQVLPFSSLEKLSDCLVIAAPISHGKLDTWLLERKFNKGNKLFDFRVDSTSFMPTGEPQVHWRLNDFFSQSEEYHQAKIELLSRCRQMIEAWHQEQERKSQIRPYGWDDL
jgi:glutamyl-tRNA reductase